MHKVGVFFGKFLPPHRGHLNAIINAATQCETLYVVVSDHPLETYELCIENHLPVMDMKLRVRWLSQELSELSHIKVIMLDETGLPLFPCGWEGWCERLLKILPEPADVIFGGELAYSKEIAHYLPMMEYRLFDYSRSAYPISGTEIRKTGLKNWDYILGAARPFFAKKILLTGTESVGKTTLTKYLAKIFHTSWSPEAGRFYAAKYMGGNEEVYTPHDFAMIAAEQYQSDMDALRHANKVVFYDSDAVVTLYYARMFCQDKEDYPGTKYFIDPSRFDHVFVLSPDVKWVDDGQRYNGDQAKREKLHKQLIEMYKTFGFADKLVTISGDYNTRLKQATDFVNRILS